MFKVIAKITVNDNKNDNKGNMFRKTPPRDGFGQSSRKTPPRELLHQQSVPSKDESKDDDNNLQEITDKLQETVVDAKEKLKEKSKKAIANILKIILVNMGMVIAIFCYTTMGALVFQILEQHNELKLCEEGMGVYRKNLKSMSNQIMWYVQFNLTEETSQQTTNMLTIYANPLLDSTNNTSLEVDSSIMAKARSFDKILTEKNHVDEFLVSFRDEIQRIQSDYGYEGQNCLKKSKWKFTSSLLFVVTVISSIGYGFISPVTWEGQLVCICYSLIGIPLFSMTIVKLSTSFGDMFTFFYIELDKINPITKWWSARKEAQRQKRREKKKENMKTSKSTQSHLKQSLSAQEGLSITQSELDGALYVLDELDYQENVDSEDSDEEEEEEHKDEVPFKLMISIFISFIFSGNYFFHRTEDWSLGKSFYFNLITLTSIGLGDLVPGVDLDDPNSDAKLLFCCCYIFFGMAVLGTCVVMILNSVKRAIRKLVKNVKKLWSKVTCKKQTEEDKRRERREMLERIKKLRYYFDEQ